MTLYAYFFAENGSNFFLPCQFYGLGQKGTNNGLGRCRATGAASTFLVVIPACLFRLSPVN